MEIDKITVPELLTFKYLTEQIPPFRTRYKRFWKNFEVNVLHGAPEALKTLADELVVRFLLIFVRDHRDIFMRFMNEPLRTLFSAKELASIRDRWGNDVDVTSIFALDRWLSRRFKESLTKEEKGVLVEDFGRALNDAKELIVSGKLFYEAIREALKSRELLGEEILKFLDSNKEDKVPAAYDRCVNFLRGLPPEYQKVLADTLVTERNYLSDRGLFAHLQRMEEGILNNYFLETLKTHARKLAKALREGVEEHLGFVYDIYYKILPKFRRQPESHFEHFLNATLAGERKHALSDREKIVYRDDASCPFCGYGLGEILKGKTSGSVECPFCHVSVGAWAFINDLIPKSELPDSFFQNPWESKGPTYRVKTFTPMIDPNFSEVLDRLLAFDISLTEKEREVIEAIREVDGQGVSISKTLGRIGMEQGRNEHTLNWHWKNAKKKLKKLTKKNK